ncbi:MAG: glycosyltransferase family 4 protein [Planctomycetota bacterium]|nr:glycosyltransferase family 4 protein [Planctomycetota bacterium]
MKIAITSLYLPSGSKIGVGYQVHYLANELVKRGHSVTVFSQTGPSADSLYSVEVVPSGNRLRSIQFAWNLRKYDFMKYDVLCAHGDDWFLWGRQRPRHIHTFHGSCIAEMIHAKRIVYKIKMGVWGAFEYATCLLADELVSVSSITRRYIPWIKHIVPCGVNLDSFSPTKQKSEAPSILFVGTLLGRKRGAMLLDLFNTKIRPVIPNAEFWAVTEEKAEGPGVQWHGRVPLAQLADLYRRAWVFCLPSSYEGFGVPYIEAMASGTPVIASPNDGAVEVTDHGKYGLLASDEELGDTIIRVLKDESLRQRLIDTGLARSRDFSWSRVCEMYEALFAGRSLSTSVSHAVQPMAVGS